MARQALILAVLCGLVPLAGCAGTEDPDVLPQSAPAQPDASSAPAASPAPAAAADPAEKSGTSPTRATPVEWEGTITLEVCAPTGVDACKGPRATQGGGPMGEMAYAGTPFHIVLNLTWTPTTLLADEMIVSVYRVVPCPDLPCSESPTVVAEAQGASPLALDAAVPALEEGEVLRYYVAPAAKTPSPVRAHAVVNQPLRLEGVVLSMV